MPTLRCIDLPKNATCRPASTPADTICWTRWTCDEKQAAITRPGAVRMMSPIGSASERSEGTNPGRSALVESASSSRTPRAPNSAKADRSVGMPSIGVGSSLKSPECTTSPSGVSKATAAASGTEWLTGTRRNRRDPCSTHEPNGTGRRSTSTPSSSHLPRASSSERAVP